MGKQSKCPNNRIYGKNISSSEKKALPLTNYSLPTAAK